MSKREEMDTAEFFLDTSAADLGAPKPFSSLVRVDFGARSDVGKRRSNNEDAYIVYRTGRYWEKLLTNLADGDLPDRHDETGYVMAVADGMGGPAAGEIASTMSLRTGIHLVLNAVKWSLKLDHPDERTEEIEEGIRRAAEYFNKINQAVIERGRKEPNLAGMGTTLTASYSYGDDFFLFHIGDTRAYLFREGRLQQLTRDHTVPQGLVDAGLLSPEALPRHHLRHVLTRSLGQASGDVPIDVHQGKLADGDRLLLCSDGLYDMVDDATISTILARPLTSQETCQALVDQALQAGGKDNVTVLLARYTIPIRS
jgi:protein phosphatase